jgi:putative transposase
MPQSLSSIPIHLVFSTKNREPFITPTIETELHPYMAKIFAFSIGHQMLRL